MAGDSFIHQLADAAVGLILLRTEFYFRARERAVKAAEKWKEAIEKRLNEHDSNFATLFERTKRL